MLKAIAMVLSAVLCASTLTGCLIIPTDYYTATSRQNIAMEPPAHILPGTTTREQVLLTLGEPDNTSPDESELWYMAEKVKAWLIMGYGGSDIIRYYVLIIRFTGSGIVQSQQLVPVDSIPPHQLEPHFSGPAS